MNRTILLCFCTIALTFFSASCRSSLSHAEKSLQGTWHVKSIFSNEYDKSGPYKDGQHKESGDLGTFTFTEKELSYSYTRLGKNYTGTSPWNLSSKKVPQSFTSVVRFTLSLKDQAYDVRFGDQTSNAEKDARQIELHPVSVSNNQTPYHILKLTKK